MKRIFPRFQLFLAPILLVAVVFLRGRDAAAEYFGYTDDPNGFVMDHPGDLDMFHRHRFERSVMRTLGALQDVLDETRHFLLAGDDRNHTYQDKYLWTELLTTATWQRLYQVLLLRQDPFRELEDNVLRNLPLSTIASSTLVFRWDRSTKCELIETTSVDLPVEVEIEEQHSILGTSTTSKKRFHIVKQYHWNVTEHYSWTIDWVSNHQNVTIAMVERTMSTPVMTRSEESPADSLVRPPETMNLTSWWQRLYKDRRQKEDSSRSEAVEPLFAINRTHHDCKTPRRNPEVGRALKFHTKLYEWLSQVVASLSTLYKSGHQDGSSIQDTVVDEWNRLLGPPSPGCNEDFPGMLQDTPALLPILLDQDGSGLKSSVLQQLMNRQETSLKTYLNRLSTVFPPATPSTILSLQEASLVLVLSHCMLYLNQHADSLNYIEETLYKQLVHAVGKELKASDFDEYMKYHHDRFLQPHYRPQPLAWSVQRPDQDPVGVVSIEGQKENQQHGGDPIRVMTRTLEDSPPLSIPLNAATKLTLMGNRTLSGWIRYLFYLDENPSRLSARARQFSNFVLLVGTMTGPNTFEPLNAVIVQNKDEVLIPLITQVLPSAKEFKSAIAALSPEQQEFARSFRRMQLTSSVFTFCIIQVKPQLELILNLPEGALTKEIKLTQDLMRLFIEYQIPSNLLSYEGGTEASISDKVKVVSNHVQTVLDVIQAAKEEQLNEHIMKEKIRQRSQDYCPSASPSKGPATYFHRAIGLSTSFLSETVAVDQELLDVTSIPLSPNEALENQNVIDVTRIPHVLDEKLERLDTDGYLKSTVVKAQSQAWNKVEQKNLLATAEERTLDESAISAEKKKAFDLLDAITRSGTHPLAFAEVHTVIVVSHCFMRGLIGTLIADNVNPITKAERSTLLLASTIFDVPLEDLLQDKTDMNRLGMDPVVGAREPPSPPSWDDASKSE